MLTREQLLEAALAYARVGLHVFPCRVGLKTPACKNGFHDATTDIEQIKNWWIDQPYNIGIATGASGLVVVDFDLVKGVAVGETNFRALPECEPLPETFTVKTRSGGKQYYFRANGTGINSSNSQLCKCVDIKAQGGYVIAPPSYVKADDKAQEGSYVVENRVKPATLPRWLELKLLDLQKPKMPNLINTDLRSERSNDFPCCEVNIEKLRQAVRNRFQSKDCSGQDEWIKLLFEFRSLIYLVGWTDKQAWSLFDEICQWERMGNYDYQNNRARWKVDDYKPDGRSYRSLLAELSRIEAVPEVLDLDQNLFSIHTPKRFKLLTIPDVLNQPNANWLVKGLLLEKGLGAIYGASNSGKSFLVIDLLMSLCRGTPWFELKVIEPRPVVYLALEGGSGIKNRLKAYVQHHQIVAPDNFHLIIDAFDIRDQAAELLDVIIKINPALVCIDTLNQSAPGSDENSNVDMSLIISKAKEISMAINGLVLLVHHTGKDATKGLRGHSSLNAALDVAIEVQNETVKNPKMFRVTKSKDGSCDISGAFKLKVVDLGSDSDGDPITSCIVERDTDKLFEKLPVGKNQLAAWDLLKNQLPITYTQAKNKFKEWLVQENPNRKRPDNTAKDAIDGLQQQGFLTLKDNYLINT